MAFLSEESVSQLPLLAALPVLNHPFHIQSYQAPNSSHSCVLISRHKCVQAAAAAKAQKLAAANAAGGGAAPPSPEPAYSFPSASLSASESYDLLGESHLSVPPNMRQG